MHSNKNIFISKTLTLLFALMAICVLNGCKAIKAVPAFADIRIPIQMLDKVNLKEKWFNQTLSMDEGAVVTEMFTNGDLLFVLNSHNRLYALNATEGIVKWSSQLCGHNDLVSHPEFFKGSLMFICDRKAIELRLDDGKIIRELTLDFSSRTTVGRWQSRKIDGEFDDYVYIGDSKGIMNCMNLKNGLTMWRSNHKNNPPQGRVQVYNDKVYFTDNAGTLFCTTTAKRENVWFAKSSGATTGPVIKDGLCFISNNDTALRCYNAEDGTMIWKHLAGGPMITLPMVTDNYIYQTVIGSANKIVCLDPKSTNAKGTIIWELDNGKQILAENGKISYAVTNDNKMVIMSTKTGKPMYPSFALQGFSIFASNDTDNTIYIATQRGAIIAMKPVK